MAADQKLPHIGDLTRREVARVREWNEVGRQWDERDATVVIARAYFSHGSLRAAFKMKFIGDEKYADRMYVAKVAIEPRANRPGDRSLDDLLDSMSDGSRELVSAAFAPARFFLSHLFHLSSFFGSWFE